MGQIGLARPENDPRMNLCGFRKMSLCSPLVSVLLCSMDAHLKLEPMRVSAVA